MLSISNFRYFSKISFLFIASPHIKTKIYLLLKVVDSKKFFLTRATIASSFVTSLVNFSRMYIKLGAAAVLTWATLSSQNLKYMGQNLSNTVSGSNRAASFPRFCARTNFMRHSY